MMGMATVIVAMDKVSKAWLVHGSALWVWALHVVVWVIAGHNEAGLGMDVRQQLT